MYDACRPHDWQVSVIRSDAATTTLPPRRRGARTMDRVLQEGQTRGTCSRSAAISASASGARYSLMPRRPTTSAPPSGNVATPGRAAARQGGSGRLPCHSPWGAYPSEEPEVAMDAPAPKYEPLPAVARDQV